MEESLVDPKNLGSSKRENTLQMSSTTFVVFCQLTDFSKEIGQKIWI